MLRADENMQDQRQTLLLGMRKEVLIEVFGNPTTYFEYRGRELLHFGQPGLSYVEIENGVITKCETMPERRAAFRVRPLLPTNVHIVTESGESSGVLLDISTSGMAITVKHHQHLRVLERAFLRFTLPLEEEDVSFVVASTFYRIGETEGVAKAIFLLNVEFGTDLYVKLNRYVIQRQTEMLLEYRDTCGSMHQQETLTA